MTQKSTAMSTVKIAVRMFANKSNALQGAMDETSEDQRKEQQADKERQGEHERYNRAYGPALSLPEWNECISPSFCVIATPESHESARACDSKK
jgi:hypothetical protein